MPGWQWHAGAPTADGAGRRERARRMRRKMIPRRNAAAADDDEDNARTAVERAVTVTASA